VDWRDGYLRSAVVFGALLVTITEALSAGSAVTRTGLIAAWSTAAVAAVIFRIRKYRGSRSGPQSCARPPARQVSIDAIVDAALLASIAAILAILAFVASLSPPNSADAMAYHLPRVIYWVEQHSIRFFPTPYLNQIMLQPFAEYFMLHSYVISGGDRFVNLVQWFGCATSVVTVSLLARHFGAGRRGQILAALFCVTLPNGILQASGAKNDYLMAAWLAAAVWFLMRSDSVADAVLAGLALGLAIGTKATAYLYAPPLLLAVLISAWQRDVKKGNKIPHPDAWGWSVPAKPHPHGWGWTAGIVAACALALNVPQFARNIDLSGSPLGFDSAFGDTRFRWRNETFGWRQTASNLIRNTTEQFGARSELWNQFLYRTALAAHGAIGADVNDPATTWPGEIYQPPRNANHEANTPNRWHLLILIACVPALWGRPRALLLYTLALAAAFVLFCFYLKWQPFMARMFLPLFVLASPLAGVAAERIRPPTLRVWSILLLSVFLVNNARPFLFENWIRPLKGPGSLLHTSRDANYFSDMTQWEESQWFVPAVDAAASLSCSTMGIDINHFQLEYPFQALLRERKPGTRFVHTGVRNVSMKYAPPVADPPCAVMCLDCAGDAASLDLYRGFGPPWQIGRFLLFSSK
jgi:hypothetical protein